MVNKAHIYKTTVFAVFLQILLFQIYGQDTANSKLFFTNNQIKISFCPSIYDNLEIKNTGKKLFKSNPTVGGEIALTVNKHIKNNFAINVGIGYAIAPHNFHYKFDYPKESVYYIDTSQYNQTNWKRTAYLHSMIVLPISLQKIFVLKGSKIIFSEVGLKFNKLIAYPFEEYSEGFVQIDTTEYQEFAYWKFDNGIQYLTSYFFKIGQILKTKEFNYWQYGIVINYSPAKIGKGGYAFMNFPFQSYGKFNQNINYLGFEIAYNIGVFKNKKHLLVKYKG